MHTPTCLLVAVLAALPAAQAGIYTKNSPVIQLTGRTYDKLITKSNYTSVCCLILLVGSPYSYA